MGKEGWQGISLPANTLNGGETVIINFSGWCDVMETAGLLASKDPCVCRRCLTQNSLCNSSPCSPSQPSSHPGLGVVLPSKHNERLVIVFSHTSTLISNRFFPYVLWEVSSFCGICYSYEQSCFINNYHVQICCDTATIFSLHWKIGLKMLENVVCCVFYNPHIIRKERTSPWLFLEVTQESEERA